MNLSNPIELRFTCDAAAPNYSTKVKGAEFIEVRNFPVPIEIEFRKETKPGYGPNSFGDRINVRMQMSNRNNPGEKVWLQSQASLGLGEYDPTKIAYLVRRLLVQMLSHEVDECFYVDGKLAHDPHPEDEKT